MKTAAAPEGARRLSERRRRSLLCVLVEPRSDLRGSSAVGPWRWRHALFDECRSRVDGLLAVEAALDVSGPTARNLVAYGRRVEGGRGLFHLFHPACFTVTGSRSGCCASSVRQPAGRRHASPRTCCRSFGIFKAAALTHCAR